MQNPSRKFSSEKIVAFTAIIISLCALVVSFYEVRIMRTQQKASVWPYVTMGQQYSANGFAIETANKGIGPAKIESVKVWVKGKQVTELDEVLTAILGPDHGITYNDFGVGGINKTVLEPGYDNYLVRFNWTDKTRELQKNLYMINIEVVYSSILGDCWRLSLKEANQPCECPKVDKKEQFFF